MRVFIVLLRRPGRNDLRDDPFWEFGSFGVTTCHDGNLMHPTRRRVRNGDRLAFIQGGRAGSRLILVTPPVTLRRHGNRLLEAKWDHRNVRPLKYTNHSATAPLVADEQVSPHLPLLRAHLTGVHRTTAAGALSSKFRARSEPLDAGMAHELVSLWEDTVELASASDFAVNYQDAIPGIARPALDRKVRYRECLQNNAGASLARCHRRLKSEAGSRCTPRR